MLSGQSKAKAELEAECKVKGFRTDRGGEFTSTEFETYCSELGINRFLTAPYTSQQNGVTERRNQTIVGMARSLLKSKKVPGRFWGEAVNTAVYLLNRAPTKSVTGMTPYEAWYHKKPKVHHLRVFGCVGHVKIVKPHLSKLEDRSTPMIFLGYEKGSKAYRLYDPKGNKVHVSRDVIFEEEREWQWGTQHHNIQPGSVETFTVMHELIMMQVLVTTVTKGHPLEKLP